MAEGVLKIQAKGRKKEKYRILRYKNAEGAWKQKSLGPAQIEDEELIGEGMDVSFEWCEGNQVELVDWPPMFGNQEDTTERSRLPDSEQQAEEATEPVLAESAMAAPVMPERPVVHRVKPVDEVQALADGLDTGFGILQAKLEDVIKSKTFPTSAHPYWHEFIDGLEDFKAEVKEWFEEDGKRFREMEDRWWGPAA